MNNHKPETRDISRRHVAEVARRALSPHFGDAEVPPALLDAVANGQGNREEVRRTTEAACGTQKPFDLVLFDTDRISEYVFESSNPPVIAGASSILDELNQEIGKVYRESTIFSGGGEGLLLVPRGEGAEICTKIEERFREQTDGALTVTTGWLDVAPHDFIATVARGEAEDGTRLVSGTQAVLSRLRDQVRDKKDGRPHFRSAVPGDSERCYSCRDRAAPSIPLRVFRDEAGIERICDPCYVRWRIGKELIAGKSFEDLAENYQKVLESEGAKTRYLGFIYADGNSMGALFGRLESLSDLRFLSHAVRDAFAMTRQTVQAEVERLVPVSNRRNLPLLSYLGGGDEAIWILPAALAVHVADRLPQWVQKASQRIPDFLTVLGEHKVPQVTLGTGLVICDLGYPVRYQYRLAKDLQRRAKEMFYGGRDVGSWLDFEVLTDSSPLSDDLKAVRELAYETSDPGFLRTCRPYTEHAFQKLLDRMRQARAPRNENGKTVRRPMANSQLYGLQSGAAEGKAVFLNYLRYQLARKPAGPNIQGWMKDFNHDWTRPEEIETFFLNATEDGKTGTWIPDGLQLAPFLDQLRKLEDAKERR